VKRCWRIVSAKHDASLPYLVDFIESRRPPSFTVAALKSGAMSPGIVTGEPVFINVPNRLEGLKFHFHDESPGETVLDRPKVIFCRPSIVSGNKWSY